MILGSLKKFKKRILKELKPQSKDTRRTSGNTTRNDPFPPFLIIEGTNQVIEQVAARSGLDSKMVELGLPPLLKPEVSQETTALVAAKWVAKSTTTSLVLTLFYPVTNLIEVEPCGFNGKGVMHASIRIDIPVCLGLALVKQTQFHLSQLRTSRVGHLHGLVNDDTCILSYGICRESALVYWHVEVNSTPSGFMSPTPKPSVQDDPSVNRIHGSGSSSYTSVRVFEDSSSSRSTMKSANICPLTDTLGL
ncbi:hypothetical protein Tco_0629739 [Tanacetum coccineum]|uniref:Uncharacterized protein n=1 Tax=Tanacetum coccineum TaxID=301880 RepID=A0ABQ4WU48_9ASTR